MDNGSEWYDFAVAAGSEEAAPASPLSMQMSNRTIDEGLDFGHGDGASAESKTSMAAKRVADEAAGCGGSEQSPPSKQPRFDGLSSSSSSDNAHACSGDPAVDVVSGGGDAYFQDDAMVDSFGDQSRSECASAYDAVTATAGQQQGSNSDRPAAVMSFDILDEVGRGDEEDVEDEDSANNGCSGGPGEEDEPEVEVDDDVAHEVKEKVILKVRGHDHFEVLPEGWIQVTHNSGMPVYLHKQSRVCTLAKPYFLGPGSIRKHEVPISGIPCLHYKREKEKEEQCPVTNGVSEESEGLSGKMAELAGRIPMAKVESVKESQKEQSLDALAFRQYCEKVFDFQTLQLRKFKTWAGRRKHKKKLKQMQRPMLPESTKLIMCSLPPTSDTSQITSGHSKREFIMNPSGKSNVCILHEYVQHAMKTQPQYKFKELESSSMPYKATVVIGEMEYGSGFGSSKKQAKSEAAKAALSVLIPQMRDANQKNEKGEDSPQDVTFFDNIKVEDPRVNDLCAKTGQLSPYQILLECLKRNYGMGGHRNQAGDEKHEAPAK
ncbi:hypothetical protein MTO96_019788 [Rhipicephalus appendiculatus]